MISGQTSLSEDICLSSSVNYVFNHYPATIFVLKMSSAVYVCCIYSSAFRLDIFMEANNMNTDQSAPREQSDPGQYILLYSLPNNISRRD